MATRLLSGTSLVALAAAFAGPALAADLPSSRAPMAPTPVASAAMWTGFYFGGNVGLSWDNMSAVGDKIPYDVDKHFEASLSSTKGLIGLQGGYNHQIGNIVVGVEADVSAAPFAKAKTGSNATAKAVEGRLGGLASLRGRLGFAFDRTLVYATAGVGVVRATYNDTKQTDLTHSATVAVVGGGLEYKLTSNVTAGLEGLVYLNNKKTTGFSKTTSQVVFSAGNVGVVRAKLSFNW